MRANGCHYWCRQDIRGSVTNIVDIADSVVKSYVYDAYGNTDSTGSFVNSFAYTGAVIDEETGLYYMNARYYDPSTGRFISQDSYRGDGESFWHLYAYCDGDPVNYTDPTGHFAIACIIIGVIVGVIAGGAIGAYYSYQTYGRVRLLYVLGGAVVGGIIGGLVGWGAGTLLAKYGVIGTAKTITSGGGAGFKTFESLKRFLGSPGSGKEWHHIVEQSQRLKSGFSTYWINNSNNMINIPKYIHTKISAYNNSIDQTLSSFMRVRDWLARQSFQRQFEFGIRILRRFGVNI